MEEEILSFFDEGSTWYQSLVSQFGEAVAQGMRAALIEQVVGGAGPQVIAAILVREFGMGLSWALRMARTALLYARRAAELEFYRNNSQVVKGWTWHAHLDNRVCISCVRMHGTVHGLDETLNDHWNGRCAMIPKTIAWADLGVVGVEDPAPVQPGEDWFKGLSDEEQRRLMGPAMWRAWQDGVINWDQLSRVQSDPVYGEMRGAPNLRELLGDAAKGYYYEPSGE